VKDDVVAGGGTIGEPPRCESLDLTVSRAAGPDLSRFSGIARVGLPREPFTVRGRVTRRGAAVALEGIEGRLHDDDFAVDGFIAVSARLEGTHLHGRAAGPDVTMAASLLGLHGIPPSRTKYRGGFCSHPRAIGSKASKRVWGNCRRPAAAHWAGIPRNMTRHSRRAFGEARSRTSPPGAGRASICLLASSSLAGDPPASADPVPAATVWEFLPEAGFYPPYIADPIRPSRR
jgi:hypothetical protein